MFISAKFVDTNVRLNQSFFEAVFLSQRVYVLSSRPGTVKEEIIIDLPRDRDYKIKRQPEFHQQADRIIDLLRSLSLKQPQENVGI